MTATKNMVELPGGTLRMGSDRFYPEERPVREVAVDGFWIDHHPLTVAEFRRFAFTWGEEFAPKGRMPANTERATRRQRPQQNHR